MAPTNRITLGNLTIDSTSYSVWVGDRRAELTFLEYELLLELAHHAGRVLSATQLGRRLWPANADDPSGKLRVHIFRLRKKIEGSRPWTIRAVKKRGYVLFSTDPSELNSSRDHLAVTQA